VDNEHSAIMESYSSNSYKETEAFAYMTAIPGEIARKFEEQARVQQVQHEMLQAQQESINDLKKMIALLLKKSKKKAKNPKTKSSSCKSKSKEEDENSTSEHSDGNENNFGYENLEFSFKELENSEDNHAKKMNELEKRLEAISNRSNLQEVVVRPYLIEWDSTPYHLRFKAPNLHAFEGKGSPKQHIYYFKSQRGNVVSNDAIMARLFIETLKGVAFEWFMKLPADSSKKWVNLEKLFLA